jgi:hypothetical protein
MTNVATHHTVVEVLPPRCGEVVGDWSMRPS